MTTTEVKLPVYRFRLECWQTRGRPLLEVPLERPDFDRAVQATFFQALREGKFAEYAPPLDSIRIVPRFPNGASALTAGFSVVIPTPDGDEVRNDFSPEYFRSFALSRLAQQVIESQKEIDGTIVYQLSAYLDDERDKSDSFGMLLEDEAPVIPIRSVSRATLGATKKLDSPDDRDMPVLIERHVIDDALETANIAPEREVGGFLLGHLCRDPETNEVFLHVTAHVPAEGTEGDETSVTFTAATWARGREVVDMRGEDEIFAGWVHSHPFRFCAECPTPPKPDCVGKILFFSPDDVFVMEQTFPRAFMVALQTAVEPRLASVLRHEPVRLYGWRQGEVVPRGFEVIETR